jgi:hypothetical protein
MLSYTISIHYIHTLYPYTIHPDDLNRNACV